jgi:hypothetical protein
MSKAWQDFWTLIFLAIWYPFPIVWAWRVLQRQDVSDARRMQSAIIIIVWVFAISATLISLKAGPELWRMLVAPFSN